jgi:hypothetical protein
LEYRQTPGVCEGHLKTEESLKFRNQTSTELEIKQLSRMNSMGMILFWVADRPLEINAQTLFIVPFTFYLLYCLLYLQNNFFPDDKKKKKMIQNV